MAKKQSVMEEKAVDIAIREKTRPRIKKMKYHPVANLKGCKNC
jgi:hypothetical protein